MTDKEDLLVDGVIDNCIYAAHKDDEVNWVLPKLGDIVDEGDIPESKIKENATISDVKNNNGKVEVDIYADFTIKITVGYNGHEVHKEEGRVMAAYIGIIEDGYMRAKGEIEVTFSS